MNQCVPFFFSLHVLIQIVSLCGQDDLYLTVLSTVMSACITVSYDLHAVLVLCNISACRTNICMLCQSDIYDYIVFNRGKQLWFCAHMTMMNAHSVGEIVLITLLQQVPGSERTYKCIYEAVDTSIADSSIAKLCFVIWNTSFAWEMHRKYIHMEKTWIWMYFHAFQNVNALRVNKGELVECIV